MTPQQHARAKEVFLAACARPAAERAALLAAECGDDRELLAHVEQLMRHHHTSASVVSNVDDGGARSEHAQSGADESEHEFKPGTPIGERYRIVSLLGRGGMGEVYRAQDLVLGRDVALKFLSPDLSRSRAWLARLIGETRVAQEVTNPYVCRVFDLHVAEDRGEAFISMEYVEGEDLRSLLRRIDRPPLEKALEIAQQLCIGLTAAHDKGVLHRDLKPANVMIDRNGDVRIMDFGLAAHRAHIDPHAIRDGTPAYMGPELFAGTGVSVRSDIYALGLVLFEVFTGRPAFSADERADYATLHQTAAPTRPSEALTEIPPQVEQVILQCLEKDPARRPASALSVAAMLPGCDALAAALAAGVALSPSQVATARHGRGLRPAAAWSILGLFGLLLAAFVSLAPSAGVNPAVTHSKPPGVLAERARQLVAELGYGDVRARESYGFAYRASDSFLGPPAPEVASAGLRLATPAPAEIAFWYRLGAPELSAAGALDLTFGGARVSLSDPARTVPGMCSVVLDGTGRLIGFEAVPPRTPPSAGGTGDCDWSQLKAAARISERMLTPAEPRLQPTVHADRRTAWSASRGDDLPSERVEAASCWGRPVFFAVLAQSSLTLPHEPYFDIAWRTALGINSRVLLLSITTLLAIPLAWSHVGRGRADREGGLRLAGFVLATRMLVWLLRASHTPEMLPELVLVLFALLGAACEAGLAWVFYLALEPYVRRFWPQTIVSWSRALRGGWRDALFGRDLLLGALVGVSCALLFVLDRLLVGALGLPLRESLRLLDTLDPLLGARQTLAALVDALLIAIYLGLLVVTVLALTRVALRRTSWAAVATAVLCAPMYYPQTAHPGVSWLPLTVVLALVIWAAVRFGLVAVVAAILVSRGLLTLPLSFDPQAWNWEMSLFVLLAIVMMAGFAACTASRVPPAAAVPTA